MFFLNLTLWEFFAALGTLGGLITALYLLDRRKRKRVVSTLRFWTSAASVDERRSRRHMQQPWSLLLQLLSLLLLLLAIAQLQWGNRPGRARDHVVLVDTSAWSGARSPEGGPMLDREREKARSYINTLPTADRVLLVKVDALAVPLGSFTSDRAKQQAELRGLSPGYSSLDLEQALAFATGARGWSGQDASGNLRGEVVYIGPARTDRSGSIVPADMRAIVLPPPRENFGIRSASVKRSDTAPNTWTASFTLRNDGTAMHRVRLETRFAGTTFAPRMYTLRPGVDTVADYTYTTRVGGTLSAELAAEDALQSDNRAELTLPAIAPTRFIAYTKRRALLAPLLEADHELSVQYLDPSEYKSTAPADVVFFDEFAPTQAPAAPAIYLHPQREASPLPVQLVETGAALAGWSAEGLREIGSEETGLREKEIRFPETAVFRTFKNDVVIASVSAGPVIVARPGSGSAPRLVVVGFDFLAPGLRASLTTPLLVANLLHWLSPEAFRPVEYAAERVGAVTAPLEAGESAERLQVKDERGQAMPFTIRSGSVQWFVDRPQTVRLSSDLRERVVSLSLPDVARADWKPPASVRSGLPAAAPLPGVAADLWQWLALAGALGLLTEWWLFGRMRRIAKQAERSAASQGAKAA